LDEGGPPLVMAVEGVLDGGRGWLEGTLEVWVL